MRFCSFFCFSLALFFSQQAIAQTDSATDFLGNLDEEETKQKIIPRAVPNLNRDRLNAVINSLSDAEVINIPLNKAGNQTFIGIFKKALAQKPKGNVLILPGDGLYPTRLNYLIEQMTEVGWNTLSLSLDDYPRMDMLAGRTLPAVEVFSKVPAKSDKDSQDKNADKDSEATDFKVADLDPPPTAIAQSNSTFDDEDETTEKKSLPPKRPIIEIQTEHGKNVSERILAAMAWLENNTDKRIKTSLVLHRESAYWLNDELIDKLPKSMPIVFLNVVTPKAINVNSLTKNIEKLDKRPILDIYNPENIQESELAKLRLASYKRAGNKRAIQTREYSKGAPEQESIKKWFAQRISAWIRTIYK